MRIAVVHDHLRFIGGGERVALTLARAFDADLYVTDLDGSLPRRAGMDAVQVREIARVPAKPPVRQDRQARAFRDLELDGYDAYVLSGNWAVFAAPRLRPNLWYCYTPVRVFYDLHDSFLSSLSLGNRWLARRWIDRRRPQYERSVASAERIVAISRNVADRVRRYLGRTAEIVYPPVDTARYRFRAIGGTWGWMRSGTSAVSRRRGTSSSSGKSRNLDSWSCMRRAAGSWRPRPTRTSG